MEKTIYRKLQINHTRNKQQDHTALMDEAVSNFRYEDCQSEYWNPEEFSLLVHLYGNSPGNISV